MHCEYLRLSFHIGKFFRDFSIPNPEDVYSANVTTFFFLDPSVRPANETTIRGSEYFLGSKMCGW